MQGCQCSRRADADVAIFADSYDGLLPASPNGATKSNLRILSEDTLKRTSQDAAHRFEHYELVKGQDGKPLELGHGAMGVTYKAVDVDLRCAVTLKVISERYVG